MPRIRIEVEGFRCARCGHEWVPRGTGGDPRVCPRCKSPFWDRDRRLVRFRVEVAVHTDEPLTGKQLGALGRRIGPRRNPTVRGTSGGARVALDVEAITEGNGAIVAKRIVSRALRDAGAARPVTTEIRSVARAG